VLKSVDGDKVVLRTENGKVLRMAVGLLCEADQKPLSATVKPPATKIVDLKAQISEKRYAHEGVALLESAIEDPATPANDKLFAEKELSAWKELSSKRAEKRGQCSI
jgi:hypothetical protein